MIEDTLFDSQILIIDDREENIALLERILRRDGFRDVTGITDPERTPEHIRGDKPDLILLDYMMPGMDGIAVLAMMRVLLGEDHFLPVIMITADAESNTRRRALESGAHDFILKPFDAVEVCLRVRNLLKMRRLHRAHEEANRMLDMQNQILDYRVRTKTRDIEDARSEILRRLALAGEYRDDDTGQHTQRVARSALSLALSAGVSSEEALMIGLAAPLHDIGKIAIPDGILLKPGKLTDEEFNRMKTHTTIGARILAGSRVPVLARAEELALTHHERWDGTGYPRGLKGTAIPLSGRILAISDVMDALSYDRPYRKAWPAEKVREHIAAGAGTHFDPELVEVFLRMDGSSSPLG